MLVCESVNVSTLPLRVSFTLCVIKFRKINTYCSDGISATIEGQL